MQGLKAWGDAVRPCCPEGVFAGNLRRRRSLRGPRSAQETVTESSSAWLPAVARFIDAVGR